jgi:hypothetical protein
MPFNRAHRLIVCLAAGLFGISSLVGSAQAQIREKVPKSAPGKFSPPKLTPEKPNHGRCKSETPRQPNTKCIDLM